MVSSFPTGLENSSTGGGNNIGSSEWSRMACPYFRLKGYMPSLVSLLMFSFFFFVFTLFPFQIDSYLPTDSFFILFIYL